MMFSIKNFFSNCDQIRSFQFGFNNESLKLIQSYLTNRWQRTKINREAVAKRCSVKKVF